MIRCSLIRSKSFCKSTMLRTIPRIKLADSSNTTMPLGILFILPEIALLIRLKDKVGLFRVKDKSKVQLAIIHLFLFSPRIFLNPISSLKSIEINSNRN